MRAQRCCLVASSSREQAAPSAPSAPSSCPAGAAAAGAAPSASKPMSVRAARISSSEGREAWLKAAASAAARLGAPRGCRPCPALLLLLLPVCCGRPMSREASRAWEKARPCTELLPAPLPSSLLLPRMPASRAHTERRRWMTSFLASSASSSCCWGCCPSSICSTAAASFSTAGRACRRSSASASSTTPMKISCHQAGVCALLLPLLPLPLPCASRPCSLATSALSAASAPSSPAFLLILGALVMLRARAA